MLSYIVRFFVALNSNNKPKELVHGFSVGFMLALIPTGNLLWVLIFAITLFLRINKAAYFLAMLLFKLFVGLLDPFFDSIGYWVLTQPNLQSFFGTLENIPFVSFFKINNSVVLGSFLVSVVFYVPVYFLFKLLIKFYRNHIQTSIVQNRIYKAFTKLPLVQKVAGLASKVGGIK